MNEEDKVIARMSIEDILDGDIPDQIILSDDEGGTLPIPIKREKINYDLLRERAGKKARKTLDALMKFYLSEEIIEEEEYLKAKMNLEHMALSNLIYMMETGEKAVTMLLRTIDSGETGPRMFEVLGGLQKTLLDIIKSQTIYMLAAEENIKRLSRDIDVYRPDSSANLPESSGSGKVSTRGQKDLMRAIAAVNAKREIEVTETEDAETVRAEDDPDSPQFDPGFKDLDENEKDDQN